MSVYDGCVAATRTCVYELDSSRSLIRFYARSTLPGLRGGGRFSLARGQLVCSPDGRPRASGEVDVASLRSAIRPRDRHLLSSAFLDAERHPQMYLQTVAAHPAGDGEWRVEAELTIRGVTRRVRAVVLSRQAGARRLRIRTRFVIDRREFGVQMHPADALAVGRRVRIHLDLLAVKR